ncbi:glycerol-3-phosphate 1-O-acyltransferase PlsY [Spiroplasma citri]|uniref:Glycerol-3-phosphate acyltransferase n=1 Tax=Spiroplasma citri TaxID=2133 RepID=A0AAX3SW83_SPICI|nr:glycerol-3-phosphate 1-O-acyltransferase PlsY [Spiroplasma citri]WFG95498.1 glycerol-3-phosphate 1-O-acyltransferase PlsY [Spiroplasma citri]WFG99386.1 glycerol-3-phosphate 1-O-acyltransferase PlsY [Spiroplasma citri]
MTLYGYLGKAITAIIGYLIGSFSWSIFISKKIYKIDVRDYHSKNAGATNTSRVLGKKWGFAIMFLDMLKVTITMFIAFGISCININGVNFGSTSYYIPAFFVLIGHSYPIYYKFKGGKTVSSFLGLLWITNPYYFLIATVVWWSTIFIWKRVSVSSILAALFTGALCWIPQLSGIDIINFNGDLLQNSHLVWVNYLHYVNYDNYYDSLALINIIITLSAIFLILKHHQNITRLLKGTEKPYDFKGKSDLENGNLSKHNKIKNTNNYP